MLASSGRHEYPLSGEAPGREERSQNQPLRRKMPGSPSASKPTVTTPTRSPTPCSNRARSRRALNADAGTERETPQFGEPGSVTTPGWEDRASSRCLPRGTDPDELLAACARNDRPGGDPPFTLEEIAEQNWVQLAQSQFDPIRVSERLWIVPSWHERLIRTPSCSCSIRAWPSAPVRTRPPGCASDGERTVKGRRVDARLRLRFRHSRDRRSEARRRRRAWRRYRPSGRQRPPRAMPSAMRSVRTSTIPPKEIKGQFDIVVANILSTR